MTAEWMAVIDPWCIDHYTKKYPYCYWADGKELPMTMRDAKQFFQLEPEPPAVGHENEYILRAQQQPNKDAFTVFGKEGSTLDGPGFIQNLWDDANSHFAEVAHLAKKDEHGNLVGIWGAMSDFSRCFQPWEDGFSKGLYLAGVECLDDAEAPRGWTKWVIPGYEYLRAECDQEGVFSEMIAYLQEQNLTLAGAVHDFTDPATGKNYMCFPIRKL